MFWKIFLTLWIIWTLLYIIKFQVVLSKFIGLINFWNSYLYFKPAIMSTNKTLFLSIFSLKKKIRLCMIIYSISDIMHCVLYVAPADQNQLEDFSVPAKLQIYLRDRSKYRSLRWIMKTDTKDEIYEIFSFKSLFISLQVVKTHPEITHIKNRIALYFDLSVRWLQLLS